MIPMDVVIPEADDSLKFAGDQQLLAELDNVDSTAIDTVTVAVKTYKYNLDQKYYLWYLRDKLVWKDELEKQKAERQAASKSGDPVESGKESSTKEGFFKRTFGNLFKKKEKEVDPATIKPDKPAQEEDDPDGF